MLILAVFPKFIPDAIYKSSSIAQIFAKESFNFITRKIQRWALL